MWPEVEFTKKSFLRISSFLLLLKFLVSSSSCFNGDYYYSHLLLGKFLVASYRDTFKSLFLNSWSYISEYFFLVVSWKTPAIFIPHILICHNPRTKVKRKCTSKLIQFFYWKKHLWIPPLDLKIITNTAFIARLFSCACLCSYPPVTLY
jgi:hypothetical protein